MDTHAATSGYDVPTYEAAPDTAWYHFLHGNVPGHQIDFIFRPKIPQGNLTRQHFSHFGRLVTYIEPRENTAYAFAIGNLSRDDTQYEPGHGGIAIVLGLRVKGALDHAGRQDPPFCHSIVCIDRHLDEGMFYEAARQFHEQFIGSQESPAKGSRWYHTYTSTAQGDRESLTAMMQAHLHDFHQLPAPRPSDLGLRWTVEGSHAPKRVVIVHPEDTPFEVLVRLAARIASVLYESDIRWTAISTGREQDLIGGTTVRFVPVGDAGQEPPDVVLMHIDQVPEKPRDIAEQLFGAHEVRISRTQELRLKWRHMKAQQDGVSGGSAQASITPIAIPEIGMSKPWRKVEDARPAKRESGTDAQPADDPIAPEGGKNQQRQFIVIVALGVGIAICGLSVAAWLALAPTHADKPIAPQASASIAPPVASIMRAPMPEESSVPPAPTPPATASESPAVPSATASAIPSATTSATAPVKKAGTTKKGGDWLGGSLREKSP